MWKVKHIGALDARESCWRLTCCTHFHSWCRTESRLTFKAIMTGGEVAPQRWSLGQARVGKTFAKRKPAGIENITLT